MAEHFIERMTWPEVEARIAAGVDAVLLPIGTTEQHGHHMPLDTDCVIARSLSERAAALGEEQGVSILIAPTLNVTLSWYHMQFPGSLKLSTTTFLQVFREVCDSLAHHGFERLITFLDAVVAIAITLLVLPLVDVSADVDHYGSVRDLLRENQADIWAFLLSFAVIARLWFVQHDSVRHVVV